MSDVQNLRAQVAGLIENCQTVISARGKQLPPVDETTLEIAQTILREAKALVPTDKVLAGVTIALPVSWTSLLVAMQLVQKTLPLPQSQIRVRTGGRYTA
jgi:hypothetical protein